MVSWRRPCACGPGDLRDWIVKKSMRFSSSEQETAFLHIHADGLLLAFSYCAGAILYYNSEFLVMILLFRDKVYKVPQLSGPQQQLMVINEASVACMWLVTLVLLVVARCQCLHRCIGLRLREVTLAAFACVCMVQLVFTSPSQLARLLNITDADLDAMYGPNMYTSSDSVMLLGLVTFLSALHLVLPIRWCIVFCSELVAVASYVVVVYVFGSREATPSSSRTCVLTLVILAVLLSLGRRRLERVERLMFLRFLSEQQLRTQAEFRLSQAPAPDAPPAATLPPDDQTSMLSSAFGQGAGPQSLESLVQIGRREQWLLSAAELRVDSSSAPLGVGGFGCVVPGYFQRTPVAIKLLKRLHVGPNAGSSLMADIGNELRILRKVRHPNVVGFHGACCNTEAGDLVLVLEHVMGTTFEAFVLGSGGGGPGSGEEAQGWDRSVAGHSHALLGVSRGLLYLHTRQPLIVHGDLKGQNVFVENRRSIPHSKLLDFGLSRVLTRHVKPLGGSTRWMAPEVFARAEPGPGSDIFSFGRLIFFGFTGLKPLASQKEAAIKAAGRAGSVIPLVWPKIASSAVQACRPFVEDMVALRPEDRPSLDYVCSELEKLMGSGSFGGVPKPPTSGNSDSSGSNPSRAGSFWEEVCNIRHALDARSQRTVPQPPPQQQQQDGACDGDIGVSTDLCYNQFKETPAKMQQALLMNVLCHWNVQKSCCQFHASISACSEALRNLAENDCTGNSVILGEDRFAMQCPQCFGLAFESHQPSQAKCSMCDHSWTVPEGSPLTIQSL